MAAQFQNHFVQDLTEPLRIRQGGYVAFNADNLSNVVSVDLFVNGIPYADGGTVAGAVICPDGATVALTGTLSGNKASVTITGDCVAIPGKIGVGIQIVNGTTKTTVLKAIYNVELFDTTTVIDPGSRIATDVGDLVNDIETAIASIPADYSDLLAAIAPTFSSSTAYKIGQYVWHDGNLYRFTNAHSAGSWTGTPPTDAVKISLSNDVRNYRSELYTSGEAADTWVVGTIDASNGAVAESASANRIRLSIGDPTVNGILPTNGYSVLIYAYNQGTYVGCWKGSGFTTTIAQIKWVSGEITFAELDSYATNVAHYQYKIVAKNSGGTTVSASDGANILLLKSPQEDYTNKIADEINTHVLTGTFSSSGNYWRTYNIRVGHSYIFQNTGSSTLIIKTVNAIASYDTIETVSGSLASGAKVTFTPTKNAGFVHFYTNGAGSFSITDKNTLTYIAADVEQKANAYTDTNIATVNASITATKNYFNGTINKTSATYGENLVALSDFNVNNGVTYSADTSTNSITVTYNSADSTYPCLQTDTYFVRNHCFIGKVYRFHVKAEILAGTPDIRIAVRGVSGNADGIAVLQNITESGEGFFDFVADSNMARLSLFIGFGSRVPSASVKFSDIWIKEFNASGIDAEARQSIEQIDEKIEFINNPIWAGGTIAGDDGTDADATGRIRTAEKINAHRIVVASGYSVMVCAYAGATYQGWWSGTRFVKATSNIVWHTGEINLDSIGDYGFRFVAKKDSGTISLSDSGNISAYYSVLDDYLGWHSGTIDGQGGEIVTNTSARLYSDVIGGTGIIRIKSTEAYAVMPYAWKKSDGAFAGHWNGSEYEKSYTNFFFVQDFAIDTTTYNYRFLLKRMDGENIAGSEAVNAITLVGGNAISESRWETFDVAEENAVAENWKQYDHQIVFTLGYIYVMMEDNTFYLSVDGGKTYPKSIGIPTGFTHDFGTLRNVYVFKSGTLLACDHQYAYYTDDWETWHQSSCLGLDGSAYVPTQYDTFTNIYRQPRVIIDGTEIYAFGNYNITDNDNNRDVVWYTVDNGHTLKVAYEFNVSGAYSCRHIHGVSYCKKQGNFWIYTGDFTDAGRDQNHLLKGEYDLTADTWTFTRAGTGLDYKWACLNFYGDYFYYCHDLTPGDIMMGKIGDEGDVTKHYTILSDLPNDPIGLFVGENSGEMAVTLSMYRSGTSSSTNTQAYDSKRMWYSSDRVNFVEIDGNLFPELANKTYDALYMFCGPNAQGKLLTAYETSAAAGGSFVDRDFLPSMFVDDFIRRAGFDCNFK